MIQSCFALKYIIPLYLDLRDWWRKFRGRQTPPAVLYDCTAFGGGQRGGKRDQVAVNALAPEQIKAVTASMQGYFNPTAAQQAAYDRIYAEMLEEYKADLRKLVKPVEAVNRPFDTQ